MRKNLNIARNLGYIDVPEEALVRRPDAMELPPDEVIILCTGCQGEPMSALTRIAYDDHPAVTVERGDTVIISAKPVPGNELRVHDAINRLAERARRCCTRRSRPCTCPGHALREELRTLLSLVRPRAVMPDPRRVPDARRARALARDAGVPADRIVLAENGSVVELRGEARGIVDRVEAGVTFVDGLGVGDVEDVALRDRRRLAEDGVLIVVTTVSPRTAARSRRPS